MTLTTSELAAALPVLDDGMVQGLPDENRQVASLLPVPIGRWKRLSLLGSLQAKVTAGYLFHWCRGWFISEDVHKQSLAEAHWRNAIRVLDSMSYMRGAVMKVGQMLAHFPDMAPKEFVDTLEQLHFNAPPMHWSLLREMVFNELGDDPENLFAEFDQQAFAAASLGQVHRARLKTGEMVAVKIQYPGIAQSIRDDFKNLFLLLFPLSVSKDWESLKEQLNEFRKLMELESNYEVEAATLTHVRSLFNDSDGIVVPRVFPHLSTQRILTMEFIPGQSLDEYLAGQPFQAERNTVARRIVRAFYRMWFLGRLHQLDFHPGNLLILDDGRLGMIDFGMTMPVDPDLWELYQAMDAALTTGRRELVSAAVQRWCNFLSNEDGQEQWQQAQKLAEWEWRPRYHSGEYDFGGESDFQEGVDLFFQFLRKRYFRAHSSTVVHTRAHLAYRALLYRLRAKIDVAGIAEQEVAATGWDRSAYAPLL